MPMRLLAISGSLRDHSVNGALLSRAATLLRPPECVSIWDGLTAMPAFRPDPSDAAPEEVTRFRRALSASNALLMSSPEYAHGVPGALKNALDWVVGSGELYGKPVALVNVSSRATIAQAALAETLRTMGAEPLLDVAMPATVESIERGDVDLSLKEVLDALARARD